MEDDKLIKLLKEMHREPPRAVFDSAYERVMKIVRSGAAPRLPSWKAHLILKPLTPMPIVLAIILVLGISGGTVAAAQNDLPDESLFPIKLWSERVAEAVTFNPERKVELSEQFAARRAEEIEALLERGPKRGEPREHFLRAVERVTEQVERAREHLEKLEEKPERALHAAARLEARIDAITDLVRRLETRVEEGDLADEVLALKEKLENAEEAVGEIVEMVERQASPEGLEHSARGIFGALLNKAEAVTKKYNRLVEAGVTFSAEVGAALEHANGKMAEARAALERGEFRQAFVLAKEAMRFFIELELKVNVEHAKRRFQEARDRRPERREEPESRAQTPREPSTQSEEIGEDREALEPREEPTPSEPTERAPEPAPREEPAPIPTEPAAPGEPAPSQDRTQTPDLEVRTEAPASGRVEAAPGGTFGSVETERSVEVRADAI